MQFHCLLPVRDEADIIGQCIRNLLEWADHIYVFDTGSVDETWEIVRAIAAENKKVIPVRKDAVYFSDTRLRGWLFNFARQNMKNGDWFLRVDADEFHHISPREFVRTRLRAHETIVYHQYYNFVLRESEVASWEARRETFADRERPIEQRRQWYIPSVYAEPRLCCYRDTMQWPPTVSFPYNAGFVAESRLPIRHYPNRDPEQMRRRCRLRAIMMADQTNRQNWTRPEVHPWAESEWRKFVTADDAEGIRRWSPGLPLPELEEANHLARPPKRVAQRFLHAVLLPLLDGMRSHWPDDAYPQPIPPAISARIEQELR
jgi:hypothetical protein